MENVYACDMNLHIFNKSLLLHKQKSFIRKTNKLSLYNSLFILRINNFCLCNINDLINVFH